MPNFAGLTFIQNLMKKTFLTICCFFVCLLSATAQSRMAEPKFIGEVSFVKADSTTVLLEKQTAMLKSKASASLYLFGVGAVKSRIHIEGTSASLRINPDKPVSFIVRCRDNESDPISIIKVFAFEVKGRQRRAEYSSATTFGGTSDNNFRLLPFRAEPYGDKSYLITLEECPAGEYGITVADPNNLNEKSLVISTFAIEGSEVE